MAVRAGFACVDSRRTSAFPGAPTSSLASVTARAEEDLGVPRSANVLVGIGDREGRGGPRRSQQRVSPTHSHILRYGSKGGQCLRRFEGAEFSRPKKSGRASRDIAQMCDRRGRGIVRKYLQCLKNHSCVGSPFSLLAGEVALAGERLKRRTPKKHWRDIPLSPVGSEGSPKNLISL